MPLQPLELNDLGDPMPQELPTTDESALRLLRWATSGLPVTARLEEMYHAFRRLGSTPQTAIACVLEALEAVEVELIYG